MLFGIAGVAIFGIAAGMGADGGVAADAGAIKEGGGSGIAGDGIGAAVEAVSVGMAGNGRGGAAGGVGSAAWATDARVKLSVKKPKPKIEFLFAIFIDYPRDLPSRSG